MGHVMLIMGIANAMQDSIVKTVRRNTARIHAWVTESVTRSQANVFAQVGSQVRTAANSSATINAMAMVYAMLSKRNANASPASWEWIVLISHVQIPVVVQASAIL